jgi:hypothetical protein
MLGWEVEVDDETAEAPNGSFDQGNLTALDRHGGFGQVGGVLRTRAPGTQERSQAPEGLDHV